MPAARRFAERISPPDVNGQKVLGWFLLGSHTDVDRLVVLCEWDTPPGWYATWIVKVTEEDVQAFWGHYFGSFTEATMDFADRVKRGY